MDISFKHCVCRSCSKIFVMAVNWPQKISRQDWRNIIGILYEKHKRPGKSYVISLHYDYDVSEQTVYRYIDVGAWNDGSKTRIWRS